MPDLAATNPAPSPRTQSAMLAAVGALLGVVLWLECIAIGIPVIVSGSPGFSVIPIAAVCGALLGLTPLRRALWVGVAAAGLLIAVVAYTPVIRRPLDAMVRADSVTGRPLQAVIVLSGGVTDDGHLASPALDRLLTGLSLLRASSANTLIVSRERSNRGRGRTTSDGDQRRLIGLLERPVRVLVADPVFSTHDEAVRMRALTQPLGITNVAVVTSPVHTRRACATFEKVGFAVTCMPSESREVALHALRSAADRVGAFRLWLYEVAGTVLYRARGWI